jgi:hypothetical protein
MTFPSFIRGGRRRLVSLPAAAGGDPAEIWTDGEGHLMTRCGDELVAGPHSPSIIVRMAQGVAQGVLPTQDGVNAMALLILALAHYDGEG